MSVYQLPGVSTDEMTIQLTFTASSPIFKDYLADSDCRCDVVGEIIDDRSDEERRLAKVGSFQMMRVSCRLLIKYRATQVFPKDGSAMPTCILVRTWMGSTAMIEDLVMRSYSSSCGEEVCCGQVGQPQAS